jgi:hypothetical protein
MKYKLGQKIKCTYHSNWVRVILEMMFLESFCTSFFNATYLFKLPFKKKYIVGGGDEWHLLFCKFGFVIQPEAHIESFTEYCIKTNKFLEANLHKLGQAGYDLKSFNELKDSCK